MHCTIALHSHCTEGLQRRTDMRMRRHRWSHALLLYVAVDLLVAHGFVPQSSARLVRIRKAATTINNTIFGSSSMCSSSLPVSTVADMDLPPMVSAASADTQQADAGRDNVLLLPFRHSSTVYIEMTDMYGIVYHANYLTYAQRAIEHAFGGTAPRVHCLHDMKYRAAATLGEKVIVEGNLLSCDSADGSSRWRFHITAEDPSRVFVSAEATLSWPGARMLPPGLSAPREAELVGSRADTQLLQPLPESFADSPKTLDVVAWSDDFEGGGGGKLSTRAVLNYFERIRTLSLGQGPDGELGLVRLHREGISIVVTNISHLRVCADDVLVGDKLEVRLGAKLSRGNRLMTMHETLWRDNGALVAHAEIALFCMDSVTHKFRSVPPWVQDILSVPSTAAVDRER